MTTPQTDRGLRTDSDSSRPGSATTLSSPESWGWWRTFEHFSAPDSTPIAVAADRSLVESEMDRGRKDVGKAHVVGWWTGDRWSIWGKRANGHTVRLTARQKRAYDRARAGGSRGELGPVPPTAELRIDTIDLDATRAPETPTYELTSLYTGPELRPWQRNALRSWHRSGCHGIVEAVTGTGKTAVGIAAIAEVAAVGRRAVVLVPTIGLQRQWILALRSGLDGVRIGSLGGGATDTWKNSDIIVSTIHSAVGRPWLADPEAIIIADEVHRYGAETFASALAPTYRARLGLTATLERSDDGVEEVLLPYFGQTIDGCNYMRAYEDGILAPVCVALVGVDLTPEEQARFDKYDEAYSRSRRTLVRKWGADDSSFGNLMADATKFAAGHGDPGAIGVARWFLKSFSSRRELLAGCHNKASFVNSIARVVPHAERTLVFSDQIDTAQAAAETLGAHGLNAVALTSGSSPAEREGTLAAFREGTHDALCAPRILDEGIDVPAADFAAVLAASKTRRQMIQRVGRIIRPKPDGRNAVFAIAYVKGTGEDPTLGGHMAFLEEFLDIAREVQRVDVDSAVPLLSRWLGASGQYPALDPAMGHASADSIEVPPQAPVDEPVEVDPRELVLTIFDDYDHIATFEEVVMSASETHDVSADTAKWEVAGADLGDSVTWVPIAGVMVGCGGSGPSTSAVRAQMMQALEDCVLTYQASEGTLGVSMLKSATDGTLLQAIPLERLAELVELIGDEPPRQTLPVQPRRRSTLVGAKAPRGEASAGHEQGSRSDTTLQKDSVSTPDIPPETRDDVPTEAPAPSSLRDAIPARLRRHNAWVENRRRLRDLRKGGS